MSVSWKSKTLKKVHEGTKRIDLTGYQDIIKYVGKFWMATIDCHMDCHSEIFFFICFPGKKEVEEELDHSTVTAKDLFTTFVAQRSSTGGIRPDDSSFHKKGNKGRLELAMPGGVRAAE